MSAKPVVPRIQANRDVEEAIAYYLIDAGPQAALGFIDSLEKAYSHLSRHPASGSSRYGHELNLAGLCSWVLHPFPHIVFYRDTEACVDVWRVLHGHLTNPLCLTVISRSIKMNRGWRHHGYVELISATMAASITPVTTNPARWPTPCRSALRF